MNQQRTDCIEK